MPVRAAEGKRARASCGTPPNRQGSGDLTREGDPWSLRSTRRRPRSCSPRTATCPCTSAGSSCSRSPREQAATTSARCTRDSLDVDEIAPLFLKHPHRSARTAGQLVWKPDRQFDIEHHVRHSALPKPGRVRELLELCSRLHSTRLAWERPLWEAHIIEGLRDGRVAMYTKTHHALVDGISAMRLLQSVLSTDGRKRGMPAMWGAQPGAKASRADEETEQSITDVPVHALRSAMGITAEAVGMPGALVKTITKGLRNETSAVSLYAPRTIFNQQITGSRRFAAQDWPIERLRAIGKATGTTLNDVVLAMCSGRDPHLPPRARRAARRHPGRDGARGPQRQAVTPRLGRGRQRGRRGDGPARQPTCTTPPTGSSRSTSRCATARRACRR